MNNNMYLYFDSNGYLKEFITCPARAGSENVNSIYFYVEPALESDRNKVDGNGDAYYALPNNVHHGTLDFKLPEVIQGITDADGNLLIPLTFTSSNYVITDIQPFDKKRDLLFFKWFQKYQFVKVDLTNNILLNAGNVLCTIGCYNSVNTKVYNLDLFSFYVAANAVLQAVYITTSQYHELLTMFDEAAAMFDIEKRIVVLPDVTAANAVDGYEDGQLFYSKASNLYYKKITASPYYELADKGILGESKVLYRTVIDSSTTIEDLDDLTDDYTRLLVANYQSQDYLLGISRIGSIYNVVVIMFNYGFNDPLVIFKGGTIDNTVTVASFITNNNKVVYVRQTDSGEKVYGTDELGAQITYDIDSDLVGSGAIVRRESGTGTVVVGTPISNTHAATKSYVDNADATKVDKRTTSGLFAYTHLGNTQSELGIATSATGDTIAKRENDGRLKVATPTSDGDATTKKYVDDKVTALGTVLNYKGTKTVAELNALTGQVGGDVYNVSDSGTLTAGSIQVIAGDNVAWDGTQWDKLSGTLDLSGYVPTSRTVNGKALFSNISLDSSDVGAVPTTRTIAGIDLEDDINAQELTNALVYADDNEVDSLF